MDKLRYCQATIMEIQRCSKVAPVSLPHMTLNGQSSKISNYTIPENSLIFPNLVKFLSDHDVFNEPDEFNPNRFLGTNGNIIRYEQFVPFGFGKCLCPGEKFAKIELFIFFVMICQKLNVSMPVSSHKKPHQNNFTRGFTTVPIPFYVSLKPRELD